MNRSIPAAASIALFTFLAGAAPARAAELNVTRPNIVYILADDLGYGDLSGLNPESKIRTPNLDAMAESGMVFTDAHSGSAVCTPTRYGVLTGRYAWRSRLKSGVLWGFSPPLIPPDRMTVASFLKRQGYQTAGIGKWHLGLGWTRKDGQPITDANARKFDNSLIDFSRRIKNSPVAAGFDYFWGISASLDMPPYVFIENDHSVGIPTAIKGFVKVPGSLVEYLGLDGKSRRGPAYENFKLADVLPTLAQKAVEFIERAAEDGRPFFLYLPLNSPHTPIAPSKSFLGRSGLNAYADFVLETDWAAGHVLKALRRLGLEKNTLVVFTSDNGCSPRADFKGLAKFGHNPSYVFRGEKADIFEGGHHVPFIVRWPGRITAGTKSADTICHTDLLATVAEILDVKLPENAGEDSVSILPDLLGTADGPVREATVHHSINGSFSIRQGKWKLELCPGSGGWSDPRPNSEEAKQLPPIQLYDLTADIGEKHNVYDSHPDVVKRLTALLRKYADEGRSTPGEPQPNDTPVDIWYARNRAKK